MKKIRQIFLIFIFILAFSSISFASEEEAKEVENKIEEANTDEEIEEARNAYEELSSADKLYISNLDALEEKENSIASTETTTEISSESENSTSIADLLEQNSTSITFGDGLSKDYPATENAADVYYYAVDFSSVSTLNLFFEEEVSDVDITVYKYDSDETFDIDTSMSSYKEIEDLTLSFVWGSYSLKIIAQTDIEGYWIIQTSAKTDYAVPLSILSEEETTAPLEDDPTILQSYGIYIFFLFLIILFIFIYLLFFKKKDKLKRKKMIKKNNEEEMEEIRKELSKMDFSDHIKIKEEEEKEENIINEEIDLDDTYEELEDGTSSLHGKNYEKEIKRYLKGDK